MARKTDYETARGYLNKKTTEYAREILPEGISVRVLISGDIDKHVPPDKDRATIAATVPETPDWTKAVLIYNRKYIVANTYNIMSYFFEALIGTRTLPYKVLPRSPGYRRTRAHRRIS